VRHHSRDDRVDHGAAGRVWMTRARPWLGLLAAVALTACGGGGGGSGSSVEDAGSLSVESISIEPSTLDLARGADTELRVVATLSNGDEEIISDSSDVNIEWEALDPDIAGVTDAGAVGVVRGIRIGNATVRAHLNGNTAWADVAVSALEVRSSQTNLPPGCTVQLSARLVGPDGGTEDVTTDGGLEWTVTDGSVATVANGAVEAIGPGTTVVRANRGQARAGGRVTVAPLKDPDGVELIDVVADAAPADPLELSTDQARRLRAVGVFDDTDLPNRDLTDCVTWGSSNDAVAEVSADGRVTAVGDPFETATVTATYDDGMSTTLQRGVTISIGDDALAGLSVSGPAGGDLVQGATAQLTATASFNGGKPDADVTGAVQWSSSDSSVATVGDDTETAGRVTAVAPGSAQVEAELGGFTDAVPIEVIAAPAAPARLIASAEPDVVLAGTDDPSTLCARLVPNVPANHVVAPLDIEFAIIEGPAGASLSSGTDTYASNSEPACVALSPGSGAGVVTVRALEPDSGLAETVDIEIVNSFSSVFDTSASGVAPAIQDGVAQAGTVFEAGFANGSNRAFRADPDEVTFCNGGNVISVRQKTPAAGDRVGAGGELDISVELAGGEPNNGFAIAVEVSDDDVPGSGFTLVHHFTAPELACPPGS